MDGAHHRDVLERHLRRAVLADRHAGVRAGEAHRRAADRGHADEVVRAAEEGCERRGERAPAARLKPDGGRDHLLLGDVHLEVALGMRLREHLGERRVGDLAVEGDDVAARRADARRARRRRPCASPPPRRARSAAARAARSRSGVAHPASGSLGSRRRSRDAAELGDRSFAGRRAACRASRSRPRRPRRPCPSGCAAKIAVGRPVSAAASEYALSICSTSWPSISIACHPKARARSA